MDHKYYKFTHIKLYTRSDRVTRFTTRFGFTPPSDIDGDTWKNWDDEEFEFGEEDL